MCLVALQCFAKNPAQTPRSIGDTRRDRWRGRCLGYRRSEGTDRRDASGAPWRLPAYGATGRHPVRRRTPSMSIVRRWPLQPASWPAVRIGRTSRGSSVGRAACGERRAAAESVQKGTPLVVSARKASIRRIVTGPGVPQPIFLLSTLTIGMISAAVPVRNASSALTTSIGVKKVSSTA
jgi:hypothetical protein